MSYTASTYYLHNSDNMVTLGGMHVSLGVHMVSFRPHQTFSSWNYTAAYLSLCPYVHPSICLSIHPFIRPAIHPSVPPSLHLYICHLLHRNIKGVDMKAFINIKGRFYTTPNFPGYLMSHPG